MNESALLDCETDAPLIEHKRNLGSNCAVCWQPRQQKAQQVHPVADEWVCYNAVNNLQLAGHMVGACGSCSNTACCATEPGAAHTTQGVWWMGCFRF
jgi:hypothetical protein